METPLLQPLIALAVLFVLACGVSAAWRSVAPRSAPNEAAVFGFMFLALIIGVPLGLGVWIWLK